MDFALQKTTKLSRINNSKKIFNNYSIHRLYLTLTCTAMLILFFGLYILSGELTPETTADIMLADGRVGIRIQWESNTKTIYRHYKTF